ncbi:multidrug resistance-associated protein 1-like [Homalodisca vitripennis]|uniref:multidrug resistance-associated protein 1-like n=1 Tax=Homalodisca vitripennis TaxID=197043 RepID=UPI001EEA7888|nr:multidrug resistance-associated protein 1-like [Homalodisca vitripennis]
MNSTDEDGFCNSKFWDPAQSWDTPDPDLSPCFEQTALVWGPCLVLWTLAPFEAVVILSSKRRDVPWAFTNVTKLFLNLVLIAISAASFVISAVQSFQGEKVYPVSLWTPAILTLTFMLAAVILVWDRVRGIHTSGGLLAFWLVLSLAGVFQFRTELRQVGITEEPNFRFYLYMIYYPIVVVMLILNLFADPLPRVTDRPKTEKPSPVESASFASMCFFGWYESLIWKGFRKPLTIDDLWNLRYHDTSDYVVAKFEKRWNKIMKKNFESPIAINYAKTNGAVTSQRSKPRKRVSVTGTMFKTFWLSILNAGIIKVLNDCLAFVNPHLLHLMIDFVKNKDYMWKGFMYAIGMLLIAQLQSVCLHSFLHLMYTVGLNWRTSLVSAIFNKALRISSSARKTSSMGEVVNLMAVDAQRCVDCAPHLHMAWTGILTVIACMFFLWRIIGVASLAGMAVLIILTPVNVTISKKVRTLQLRQMKVKDERVKIVNEVLSGMKVLKLYAWEPSFKDYILAIREREMTLLKSAALWNASTSFFWLCSSFLVSFTSFGVFVLLDERNVLTPEIAFVACALFNVMRFPIYYTPMMVQFIIQFLVALKRINKFMNADELDFTSVSHDTNKKEPLIIEDGTFSWGNEEDDKPVLRNITLKVQPGHLVAVVGAIGAGKTSLISAFMGEMVRNSGYANTKGRIAYVAQQAWIQNATVKDNIVFGSNFDEKHYFKTVKNCALEQDFKMLSGGDATEIGEKGINLSGGQKQRVSLARAVYSDAEIYLMDDPLSAVDAHVGKHIFENVIGPHGQLKNKTRILVTHGIAFLPQVDVIVVMKGGEIMERGTFKELLEKKGEFSEFLIQHLAETDQHEETQDIQELLDEETTQRIRKISKSESLRSLRSTSRRSSVNLEVQSSLRQSEKYLSDDMGSTNSLIGLGVSTLHFVEETEEPSSGQVVEMSVLKNGEIVDSGVAVADQNDVESETEELLHKRLSKVRSSKSASDRNIASQPERKPISKLIQVEAAETGKVKWSVYFHYFSAMGYWLVVTTVGFNMLSQALAIFANIWLSKWSSDASAAVNGTQVLDKRNSYLHMYTALGFGQVLTVVASSYSLAFATIYASRNLHLSILSNILRCPMSFFDTTPLGRIVNRLGKDVDVVDNVLPVTVGNAQYALATVFGTFIVIIWSTPVFALVIVPLGILYYSIQVIYVTTSRQLKRIESVSRSPIYSHFSETLSGQSVLSFLKLLFDVSRWLGIRLETIANILIFFAAFFAVLGRDSLDPGIVGLSISYALQITFVMNAAVRMASEIETSIVSVERIKEYAQLPQEAAWIIEPRPSPEWPGQGVVKFQDYKVRYREGLDLILKGISFTVSGSEKIGIVGRTGAGKSSLTLCLFRIIEAAGGHIYIDDLDIAKIGLGDLRSKLTIVPQDPVLFSGHLRMNLDPFEMFSDTDIWCALELAHLSEYVKSLPQGLKHPVAEGGENLSIGQRQLICLARALLRKTKVLILDEATAAIDLETDDLIQQTIRREFRDCTVLTIAHRLNTIMDSDRVLVLDQGLIKEFDSPKNLLKSSSSIFYGLAKDAGLI